MSTFADRLIEAIQRKDTPCIAGLDPSLDRVHPAFFRERGIDPKSVNTLSFEDRAELLYQFCAIVLNCVHRRVAAVKPQSAYFERYGAAGVRALERLIVRSRELGLLVILDAKRGDIDATSQAYADAYLGAETSSPVVCDCITLNPYLGNDSMQPFVDTALTNGKGVFICVKTSNAGANTIQNVSGNAGKPVYELVAELLRTWVELECGQTGYSSVGAVVGATYPDEARSLRRLLPKSIFLVPGYGAQGGSDEGVRACFNKDRLGAVVNNSRAVLYPHMYGDDDRDYQGAITRATVRFVEQVRRTLVQV